MWLKSADIRAENVFVAFENGICPGYTRQSHKIESGTNFAKILMT